MLTIKNGFSKQSPQMFQNYASENVLLINLQFSQKQSGYFSDDPCIYVGHPKSNRTD
jgi:hypothetical protein